MFIDAEGFEHQIFMNCDIAKYSFTIVSIEHKHSSAKLARIDEPLATLNCVRAFPTFTV